MKAFATNQRPPYENSIHPKTVTLRVGYQEKSHSLTHGMMLRLAISQARWFLLFLGFSILLLVVGL